MQTPCVNDDGAGNCMLLVVRSAPADKEIYVFVEVSAHGRDGAVGELEAGDSAG